LKFNNEALVLQFRGLAGSLALEQRIRLEHEKLAKMAPRLMRCRVTVSKEHQHQHQGFPFEVHVELTLPGSREIVATRRSHEDVYVALKGAFSAMHQQLERVTGRQHDRTKSGGLKRALRQPNFYSKKETL
jgi:ribosomal subunit interface protein